MSSNNVTDRYEDTQNNYFHIHMCVVRINYEPSARMHSEGYGSWVCLSVSLSVAASTRSLMVCSFYKRYHLLSG